MKVRELMEKLREYDPEMPVCTWSEYSNGPCEVADDEVIVEDDEYFALPVSHDSERVKGSFVLIG